MNLITSCVDCNSGKSAKILGEVKPTPDADLLYLKTEQQRMEYERYIRSAEKRDAALSQVIQRLSQIWGRCFGAREEFDRPADHIFIGWLAKYPPDLIERAIEASAPAYQRQRIGEWCFDGMVRYVSAVMRNMTDREEF